MINPFQSSAHGVSIDKNLALTAWVIFLSCIIVPLAVVVNFNMGYNQFKIEMSEHWVDYQANTQDAASTAPAAPSSAAMLETTYNKIARTLNDVCVTIAGGRVINGVPDQVHGSGVIVAEKYVLTNFHVIENATDIAITVYSPRATSYSARVVMTDRVNDLALMQVDTAVSLPSAILGNPDRVKAGDMVFAMGNAFGSGNVFTTGVVCDKSQSFVVDGRQYIDMIRTETYMYPGSSGGPLADVRGEIIGINTAIYDPQGKFTGIGFATPITRAAALLQRAGLAEFNGLAAPAFPAAYGVNGSTFNNKGAYSLAA